MKKIIALALTVLIALSCLTACGKAPSGTEAGREIKVGICNYVDDASLNQIVDNIQSRLKEIGEEKGVPFNVSYDNCNADANLMNQIISNFIADGVDIMVGVATPVAMAMQAATEDNQIPVVFAAVSDPVSTGIVESLEAPGSNVTGTSDALNTAFILDMMLAANPDIKTVADLAGKKVSIGAAGSGVYFNAIDVLNAYDLKESDISAVYQSFGDSAESLKDGKIDAAFIVAGAPTTAITDLATAGSVYLVSLDDSHVQSLLSASPYYTAATIKAGTY